MDFGRAQEVKPLLEVWDKNKGSLFELPDRSLALAINILTGEDKDRIIEEILGQLKEIVDVLSVI